MESNNVAIGAMDLGGRKGQGHWRVIVANSYSEIFRCDTSVWALPLGFNREYHIFP